MQRDYKRIKFVILVIVIVMLVTYAFIACWPHGHECVDADCVICNVVDTIENILLSPVLLSIVQLFPLLTFILSFAHERIVSLGESTPVGLKVKLLD